MRRAIMSEKPSVKSKMIRCLEVGEIVEALSGPERAPDLDVQRFKCIPVQGDDIGWVTMLGNRDTRFFELCPVGQLAKPQRLAAMLDHMDRYADVIFVVGPAPGQRFPAARWPFAQASEVFDRMLYPGKDGPGFVEQQQGCSDVRIVDMAAETFEQLQRWVHGLSPAFGAQNAFAIAQAADKYAMHQLQDQVDHWISDSLTRGPDALQLFDVAVSTPWLDARESCTLAVCMSAKIVLEAGSFLSLSEKALMALLLEDRFAVSEEKLFLRCVEWARKKKVKCVDPVEELLRRLVKNIRVPLMSATFFAEHVAPLKILDDSQSLSVLCALVNGKTCEGFVSTRRTMLPDRPLEVVSGNVLRAEITAILTQCSSVEGLHVDSIAQAVYERQGFDGSGSLPSQCIAELRACLEDLLDDGEAYTTITQDHFALV